MVIVVVVAVVVVVVVVVVVGLVLRRRQKVYPIINFSHGKRLSKFVCPSKLI